MPMKQDDPMMTAGLDDELDAVQSAALQRRLETDAALREAWDGRRALRRAVREGATYHAAPETLRRQLEAALGLAGQSAEAAAPAQPQPPEAANDPAIERRHRPWGYAFGAAIAASLATLLATRAGLATPPPVPSAAVAQASETAEAVNAHARASLVGQPIEVASSDQHTVRPWLTARLSFVPPIVDLAPQGYPLVGARRDVIAGETVATLVYRHGPHGVSVFIRPTAAPEAPPVASVVRGFNVIELNHGGMRFNLVSDLNAHELAELAGLLRRQPAG